MLRVIDLFAGAGGFGLGFKMAGFHIEHAIEIDEWAAETLSANHGADGTRVWCEDISTISDSRISSEIERYPDVIIGGPPCQGFSIANNGRDSRDPRNTLFVDFLRFVRVLEPRVVLLENVTGLLRARTSEGASVIGIIEQELTSLGYEVSVATLQATAYGVPQIRERVFICGSAHGVVEPRPARTHAPASSAGQLSLFPGDDIHDSLKPVVTLWEAISDLPQIESSVTEEWLPYTAPPANDYQRLMRAGSAGIANHIPMRHTRRMIERFRQIKWGQSQSDVPPEHAPRARNSNGGVIGRRYDQNNRRMRPDEPCHTIPASFYANFVHPYLDRNFTPREGARIQSFPDRYVFKGKPTVVSHKLLAREGRHDERKLCQYNQIGNAVPPLLAEALARHILSALDCRYTAGDSNAHA